MYNSLQELSNNGSNLSVRSQVVNYGKSLTEFFNSLSKNLKNIQEECNFEIRNMVDKINSTAQQIAALTKQINTLEVSGGTANDLRDQRALLVDELSQVAGVTVSESVVGAGIGVTTYLVKIDGQTLVDGANYNKLQVVPRQYKNNQNDIDGLYDIVWESGQSFNLSSQSLGGALKALYEIRDGNNRHNLQGSIYGIAGDSYLTLTDTNINEVEKLNIPETGVITVENKKYAYTGFEVNIDEESGKYTYTFELEEPLWRLLKVAMLSVR